MAKEIKSEAEIAALIEEEIKQFDVCAGVRVVVVRIADDGYTNWDVSEIIGKSGAPVLPDCKHVVMNTVIRLRNRYELVTDA